MPIDWTFGGTWPYQPRWFDTPDGRIAYVDEGPPDARPVVLVHGNPDLGVPVPPVHSPLVAAGHRVIVPDHLGFGRSDKPDDPALYRIQAHQGRMEALLEALDLREATVVPHDQGGPIGLGWAVRHPDRHFRDKPVMIIWAMKDVALTPEYLERWLGTFPNAKLVQIQDAGHYLQEDASERIIPELVRFLHA
jgi:pimeloyl-ACP methyl ester carboxylesterase